MSLLSGNHTFQNFYAAGVNKSVALDSTQRLAKVTFKTVTDKVTKVESKRDSICVSIPAVTSIAQSTLEAMKPHILAMYLDAQDGILREMVLAGKTSVNDVEIADTAVIEYLDSVAEGERLTKQDVVEWFNAANGIGEMLTLALANSLGISDNPSDEQTAMVTRKLNQYRECYASLAGGKTRYEVDAALKLRTALVENTSADDEIAKRFVKRLDKMMAVKPVTADDL